MKRVKIKILAERMGLIVFGLIIGLLLLEGVCWLLYPKPHNFYHESALYGLEFTPNDEGWYSMPPDAPRHKIIINSKGLRDVEHFYEKSENTKRILILGDSYAAALEIPLEEIFPRLLESMLNKQGDNNYEVINASAAARSPLEEARFYESEGYKYKSDLVILAFAITNDLRVGGSINVELNKQGLSAETKSEKTSIKASLLKNIKSLLAKHSRLYYLVGNTLPGALPSLANWLRHTGLLSKPWFRDLYIYAKEYPPDVEVRWDVTFNLIANLNQRIRTDGANLAVLIIPSCEQVYTQIWDQMLNFHPEMQSLGWDLDKPNRILTEFLEESGIPYLDLLPSFRQHYEEKDDGLYLRIDRHFNKLGHYLTAQLICDWIEDNETEYR